jgi:DNA-directed RNA polymerase subunit L
MFKQISISDDEKKFVFSLKDVDVAYVNAIRRVILAEIPTIAISYDPYKMQDSDITFKVNNSVIHNEFLGHRISLCPLFYTKTEIESFNPDLVRFALKKKNKGQSVIQVTTDDIKYAQGFEQTKPIKEIFPHDPITQDPILLTKLKPNVISPEDGEELDIEFGARVGIAKQHSRWSAVSTCTYENMLDEKLVKEKRALITDPSAFNQFDTLEKYRLFYKNEYGEPNAFKFTIESECAMSAYEILHVGLDILHKKVTEFKFEVEHSGEQTMHNITIKNEDHTLGNLLQTYIYNNHIRNSTSYGITYVGYYMPHPLESNIVVKIKSKNEIDIGTFINFCSKELGKEIKQMIAKMSHKI